MPCWGLVPSFSAAHRTNARFLPKIDGAIVAIRKTKGLAGKESRLEVNVSEELSLPSKGGKPHQWQANLRILDVTEIKTVPYVPSSHPFVERLIGTVRRECLDRTLFWTTADLENKLLDFKTYFNHHRTHTAREGRPPDDALPRQVANLQSYRWESHCRGLYQTAIAA